MGETLSIVLRREHLRKTVRIAIIVGCVLTLINQLDVFLGGKATALTIVKTCLNFCVPFIVSNLGLLAGKRAEQAAEVMPKRTESGILWNPEVAKLPPPR